MSATRLEALTYLGYRAVVAQPLKRLGQSGTAEARFVANYHPEGLSPLSLEDRAVGFAASKCIGCGLCELGCDLAAVIPATRAMGIEAVFRLYSKSTTEMPAARDAFQACLGCKSCDPLCPVGVPISSIVRHFAKQVTGG